MLLTKIYSTKTGSELGSSQIYERVKHLGGDILAGNKQAAPEFISLIKKLNTMNIIPSDDMNDLLRVLQQYLNII